MSSETDELLHKRRLRRAVSVWRALAVLAAVAAVAALVASLSRDRVTAALGGQIARIEVKGPIVENRPLLQLIERIGKDESVKAVIVAIDSPGGTTVGGESLYKALRALSETKPVVSVIGTVGTSAAYMTALATDRIFTWRTSITGSIGVLIQYGDVAGLLETVGVSVEKVDSGPLKAEPTPFGPPPPAAIAMLQGVVDDSYEWFVDLLAERREIDPAAARRVADGRIMTGHQALAVDLVDEIGGEDAAIAWLENERSIAGDLPVRTFRPRRTNEGGFLGAVANRIADRIVAGLGIDQWGRLGDGTRPFGFVDGLSSVWQVSHQGGGRSEEASSR